MGSRPRRKARPGAPYLAGAPLLIAHRGGAALAPENTLTAFRQAIDWWGADLLEIDVQPTRDGEVVVFHDADLDRTTDRTGPIALLSLDQVRALDAGYHFSVDGGRTHPYRAAGVGVATLGELLAQFPGVRINIEVKDPRAQERVAEVIRDLAAEERVLIAAAHTADRSRIRSLRCPVSASGGQLRRFYIGHRLGLARAVAPPVDALQMPERYAAHQVLTPGLVAAAHAQNIAVHVWTVDDPAEMRRLLGWRVDGIITDRPDRLAVVLHQLTHRPLPRGPQRGAVPPSVERLLRA